MHSRYLTSSLEEVEDELISHTEFLSVHMNKRTDLWADSGYMSLTIAKNVLSFVSGALCQKLYSDLPAKDKIISENETVFHTQISVQPSYAVIRMLSEADELISIGVTTWDNDTPDFEQESDIAWSVAEQLYLDSLRLKGNPSGMEMARKPIPEDNENKEEQGKLPSWVVIIDVIPPHIVMDKYPDLHWLIEHLALSFMLVRKSKKIAENRIKSAKTY